MPTQQQIEAAIVLACECLKKNDGALFSRNINERTLSHKFAMYLQAAVDSWGERWDVDCEFNRSIQQSGEDYPKRLNLIGMRKVAQADITDEDAATVFPDVIVH